MPLTSAQIVTRACSIAQATGFTVQAGQFLNMILQELCQNYNFDLAKDTYVFNFSTSQATAPDYPNVYPGGGPYPLPDNFLRMVDDKDAMWFLNGVPYPMIPVDLSQFDNMVQQAGLQSYPYIMATDMSQSPPNLLIWPPPAGNYQAMIRYFSQMADITTPESSTTVPWFPQQNYLVTRLAGLLMNITNDARADRFLGDGPAGAQGILNRYLDMKDDSSNRAQTVKLDRRRFGRGAATLKNTKSVGWVLLACAMMPSWLI